MKILSRKNSHSAEKCKRGTLWYLLTYIQLQNIKNSKGTLLRHSKTFRIKSHSAEKHPKRDLLGLSGFIGYLEKVKNERGTLCTKFVWLDLAVGGFRNVSNQSRICGKGADLGLFPSDSLQPQSYQFIGIAHIGPYYGVENDCRNFRSNRTNSVSKNQKNSKNGCFLAIFGLI